jgi:hypothetical protein
MKRFLSLLMLIAGVAACLWGGYYTFSDRTANLHLPGDVTLSS